MDVIGCNGFSPGLGAHCWDCRILHLYIRPFSAEFLEPSSLWSGREWEPSSSLSLHGQAWEDPGNEFEHNLGLWFCLSACMIYLSGNLACLCQADSKADQWELQQASSSGYCPQETFTTDFTADPTSSASKQSLVKLFCEYFKGKLTKYEKIMAELTLSQWII